MRRENALMGWKSFVLLICLALGLGWMYRFADLWKRPMHTDEAILALKTQDFWRSGHFEYDPKDFHGPLLHHVTRATGWVKGYGPDDLDEQKVREVTAVCGLLLILVPLFFVDALGKLGVAMAALLIATSPMMNFYSRYYIMEMLMVLLGGVLLGLLWCWAKGRKRWWLLLLAGASVGGMHATKETFIFELAAIFAGVVLVKLFGKSFEAESSARMSSYIAKREASRALWLSWIAMIIGAALVSVWLFSNGFKDWKGVTDSVMTYASYLQRSEGSGHEKTWDYYLRILFWYKDGFVWSEVVTGVLAVLGLFAVLFPMKQERHWHSAQIFLAGHTLALLGAYSVIPYKTPWTILGGNFSLALLAGLGAKWLFTLSRSWILRTIWFIGIVIGVYHLCQQTSRATDYSFVGEVRYSADSRNPFVYSHTSTNFMRLVTVLKDLKEVVEDGENSLQIDVVQDEFGWPLPWYLREMKRVSYQDRFPEKLDVQVLIVDMNREQRARDLLKAAYEPEAPPIYVSSVFGLRPGVNLVLLVRGDLWQKYLDKMQGKETKIETPTPNKASPSETDLEIEPRKINPASPSKENDGGFEAEASPPQSSLQRMGLQELEGIVLRPGNDESWNTVIDLKVGRKVSSTPTPSPMGEENDGQQPPDVDEGQATSQ